MALGELGIFKYTTASSSAVKPPRLVEAPASLECREWETLEIGGNRFIIGLVLKLQVRDELFDREKLRIKPRTISPSAA